MSTKVDIAYCAGIVDGEGSIFISKRKERRCFLFGGQKIKCLT